MEFAAARMLHLAAFFTGPGPKSDSNSANKGRQEEGQRRAHLPSCVAPEADVPDELSQHARAPEAYRMLALVLQSVLVAHGSHFLVIELLVVRDPPPEHEVLRN